MRNGITPVVAIVLLLMMTVATAGGAYAWLQSVQGEAQERGGTDAATGLALKAVSCGSGIVDVTVSNTGSIAIDAAEANLFVRFDGDLEAGRTDVATGSGTLAPGETGRFRFTVPATLEAGRRYGVELGFPRDELTVTGSCDGGTAGSLLSADWRMDDNVTAVDSFEGGTDGASIPDTTEWVEDGLALEYDDGTAAEGALSAYTTDITAPSCPLMHRRMFDRERNVSRFTSWYRETGSSTGHGVSLRDADRERILGWYTNNPEFGVYSSAGFDGGQDTGSLISGLSYTTWYQVNVTLDWTARNFTVVHSGNASKTLGPYPLNGSPQYLYLESSDDNNWECNNNDGWVDAFRFTTDITDRAGDSNLVFPGTVAEEPAWDASCRTGGCFDFDGVDDHLYAPDRPALDDALTSGFTVSAWVNITIPDGGDGNEHQIVGKDTDYSLHIQTDGTLRIDNDGNGGFEADMGAISGWTHVAASVNSSGDGSLFVDGERIGTGTFPINTMGSSNPLYIGAREWGSQRYFDGRIDDVTVAPHVLR